VKFAHHGRPSLSVQQKAAAIQRQRGAVRAARLAHFEAFSDRRLWPGNGDGVTVRGGNRRGKNGKAPYQTKFPQVKSSHKKKRCSLVIPEGARKRKLQAALTACSFPEFGVRVILMLTHPQQAR
jgi:hypothetical protein